MSRVLSSNYSIAEGGRNNELPTYLQILPDWRVVLCTTHGCYYTRQNLSRHLLEKYRLRRAQRVDIKGHMQL